MNETNSRCTNESFVCSAVLLATIIKQNCTCFYWLFLHIKRYVHMQDWWWTLLELEAFLPFSLTSIWGTDLVKRHGHGKRWDRRDIKHALQLPQHWILFLYIWIVLSLFPGNCKSAVTSALGNFFGSQQSLTSKLSCSFQCSLCFRNGQNI